MEKRNLAEHTLTALKETAERRRGAVPESAPALESRDGRGRAKQAGIVPDNPLHSRHPWRSDARAALKELNAVLADLQATRAELHEKDEALVALRAELDSQREQRCELTEHVRTDERFRVVAESAPCALVMVNQAGEIVFVKAQAEALFGYQRDELMSRTIELLLPKGYRGKHAEQRAEFLSETQAARHMGAGRDLCCVCKDGSECPVEIGLTQIETSEGRLVLSSIVDISERRRLEQQLEDRNREISRTQALAVVGRMANMVAHDLRNPLSSIKMGLQILGKQPAPHSGDEERELKQIALEQVRYMEGILVDLLDYSRESPLKPDWLRIDELLDAATLIVQKTVEERGAHVTTRYQSGLPTLHGDGDKLRQVFSNLLVNAVQATEGIEDCAAEIHISTHLELGPDRPRIRIEIRDTGCGVEPGQEEKLFEPFHTTRAKGTGLGLAIVRRIIRQHHGSVHLESVGKRGTRAVVALPTGPIPELRESDSTGTRDVDH
jgi:PAS domain S-box-containing protein